MIRHDLTSRSVPSLLVGIAGSSPAMTAAKVDLNGGWYARRVGVAAARKINTIPAARRSNRESVFRAVV
jgi:hypothetical protein